MKDLESDKIEKLSSSAQVVHTNASEVINIREVQKDEKGCEMSKKTHVQSVEDCSCFLQLNRQIL